MEPGFTCRKPRLDSCDTHDLLSTIRSTKLGVYLSNIMYSSPNRANRMNLGGKNSPKPKISLNCQSVFSLWHTVVLIWALCVRQWCQLCSEFMFRHESWFMARHFEEDKWKMTFIPAWAPYLLSFNTEQQKEITINSAQWRESWPRPNIPAQSGHGPEHRPKTQMMAFCEPTQPRSLFWLFFFSFSFYIVV